MPIRPKRPILTTVEPSEQSIVYPFTEEEYRKGIATLKNNKAVGIDNVLVEQLKHLVPRAHRWLHSMLSTCFTENNLESLPYLSQGKTLRFQKAIHPSHSYVMPINCTNDSF